MLQHFGIDALKLMTNNPRKIDALKNMGINAERIELITKSTDFNARYLATKANKLGHLFPKNKEHLSK